MDSQTASKKGLTNSIEVTQSYSHSDSLGSLTTDMPDSSKESKQPTRFHQINRALHQSATLVCKKACPVCFPSTACFRQLPDFQHTKPHHTTFNTSLLLSQVAESIWVCITCSVLSNRISPSKPALLELVIKKDVAYTPSPYTTVSKPSVVEFVHIDPFILRSPCTKFDARERAE